MSSGWINLRLLGVSAAIVALVANASNTSAAETTAMCASPEQANQVQEFYKTNPGTIPAMANSALKLPDAIIASGLPADQSYGTNGAAFIQVWESMMSWDSPVVIIIKSGSVMEVRGKLRKGTPSQRSNYFNVDESGPGFSGHLRGDLVAAIYALELPATAADSPLRGILFFDAAGDSIFGVYAAGEGEGIPATPALVAQFEQTRALVKSLPLACER